MKWFDPGKPSEDYLKDRDRVFAYCEIIEEDTIDSFMSKIANTISDLFAQVRLLKESQVHSHLPIIEREIAYLEASPGLDYDQTKQLEVLIKLKQFIYEKPTGLSRSVTEKLSEAELIEKLSPKTESQNESD